MASLLLGIIIIGFSASLKESKFGLELYIALISLCTVVLLIQSSFVAHFAVTFDSYYELNSGKLAMQVDKEYFSVDTMGCYGGKYSGFGSNNYFNLKCENKD